MTTKYILVYFDSKESNFSTIHKFISSCIEQIWSDTYRNRCLKLSNNTVLVRVFESDFESYPYPKDRIDDVIALVQFENQFGFDISTLKTFVLPIHLDDIKDQTFGLEKELAFLENLTDKKI